MISDNSQFINLLSAAGRAAIQQAINNGTWGKSTKSVNGTHSGSHPAGGHSGAPAHASAVHDAGQDHHPDLQSAHDVGDDHSDDHHSGLPWWAWLLIALAIVLVLVILVVLLVRRFRSKVFGSASKQALPVAHGQSTSEIVGKQKSQFAESTVVDGDLGYTHNKSTMSMGSQGSARSSGPAARSNRQHSMRSNVLRSDTHEQMSSQKSSASIHNKVERAG